MQGHLPDAIDAYRRQIEVNSNDKFAHLNLARVLEIESRWDEALQEAQKAADIAPRNPESWIALGRAQARTGKAEDARKSFYKALDVNDSTTTQNHVAYSLATTGVDLDRAWQLASSAVEVDAGQVCTPDRPVSESSCIAKFVHLAAALDTAGWILFKQEKIAQAQSFLEASYAVAPEAEVVLHLAAVYAKQSKPDAAIRLFAIARLSPAMQTEEVPAVRAVVQENVKGDLNSRLATLPKSELIDGYIFSAKGSSWNALTFPAKLSVLVDPTGKILEAKSVDATALTAEQLSRVQSLRLLPLRGPVTP